MIYKVFSLREPGKITANLDVFCGRFNRIQFWVATVLCQTQSLNKRVQLLKKFISVAAQ